MTPLRQLSWENFRAEILRSGQRVHRVSADPQIDVFADTEKGEIGAVFELSEKKDIPTELKKLEYIQSELLREDKKYFIRVSSCSAGLQRQFYQFATAVADRIILENTEAIPALLAEIECFDDLLASQTLLSVERQLGLIGELLVLDSVIDMTGPAAVDSWTGPAGEPHDFRLNGCELEVKTTAGSRRLHYIHGLDQLVPSQGMKLFVVSVLLEPAGKAEWISLQSMVQKIRARIQDDGGRLKRLNDLFAKSGLRDADLQLYSRKWRLRRPVGHAEVGHNFPRISRPDIVSILGGQASRIDYLEYSLNLEGLVVENTDFRIFTGAKII